MLTRRNGEFKNGVKTIDHNPKEKEEKSDGHSNKIRNIFFSR